MANNYTHQKKVLLLAAFISLAIHGLIIALLSGLYQEEKVSQLKKKSPINVEVEVLVLVLVLVLVEVWVGFLALASLGVLPFWVQLE